MAIEAVIFDVDGTLIDTVDLHAASWREALHKWGVDVPHAQVRAQIGKGSDLLMPVFLPKEVVEAEGEEIEAYRKRIFMDDYLPRARPFPRVRDLFVRLREDRKKIVLASSAKGDELERYVELAGIGDIIQGATSSSDAEKSKPHPDIFMAALEQVAPFEAGQCIVIGDTPYDAEAAGKAGLATIGLLTGGFAAEDLRAAGCLELYWDPADLLAGYESSRLTAA